ncbi:MAG: PilZ domain-containing protein [Candidatus Omnitrophota bacterium]
MGEQISERRQYPRLNVYVDIQYHIKENGTRYGGGSTSNISAGGICMIFYEEPKPGSVLDLVINLPDGQRGINAKGRVVWVKPFSVALDQKVRFDAGIQFMNLLPPDKQRIDNYIFRLK